MKILEWLFGLNADAASCKQPFRKFIQTEIAILYLSILQLIHRAFLYFLKVAIALMSIYLGIFFIFMALAVHSKNIIVISWAIGVIFIAIPIVAIVILLSPSTWMKVFKMDKFLKNVREGAKSGPWVD